MIEITFKNFKVESSEARLSCLEGFFMWWLSVLDETFKNSFVGFCCACEIDRISFLIFCPKENDSMLLKVLEDHPKEFKGMPIQQYECNAFKTEDEKDDDSEHEEEVHDEEEETSETTPST